MSAVPDTIFPIYVHLQDADDLTALAIHIIWAPYDSTNQCYTLVSAPSFAPALSDSAYGTASAGSEYATFAGDSEYTWTISFPPGSARRDLIAYFIAPPLCPNPPPATFILTSVLAMDTNGDIDSLSISGQAIIAPVPTVTAVSPELLPPNTTPVLTIRGSNFTSGAQVSLRSGDQTATAIEVAVEDSTTIEARFLEAPAEQGPLDVVVALPNGLAGTLLEGVTVQTATSSNTPLRPTDDANAFHRIDMYADRVAHNHDNDHINVDLYPDSLQSPTLLVTRSPTDTAGIFDSRPHDAEGLLDVPGWHNSFVRYTTGSQAAASVGLLSVGSLVFNGAGAWQDAGKSLLKVITQYVDGDSTVDSLSVGVRIRNYQTGALNCNLATMPYYVALPTDTLAGQTWTGSQSGTQYFYDVQELRYPEAKRRKRIGGITIRADSIQHDCTYYSTSALFGVSLWNKFAIAGPGGAQVAQQSQNDPQWATEPYGGYMYNDTLVGANGTMADLGCFLVCISMAHNFYGVACTPHILNHYLQNRPGGDGFFFSHVATITSVNGDSVTFVDTTASRVPRFLIHQGRLEPRATVEVQGWGPDGKSGWGRIIERFRGGAVGVGSIGVVYDEPNYNVASEGFSVERWQIVGYHGFATAALVESTLAVSSPAFVYTGIDSVGAKHWVLADGREPAFTSPSAAKGTYRIADPAYLDASGAPLRRLIQEPYNNEFQDAVACSSMSTQRAQLSTSAVSAADSAVLAITLRGAGTLDIRDPNGARIQYNASVGAYNVAIPRTIGFRRHRIVSPTTPSISTGQADLIQIHGGAAGTYYVGVSGEGSGAFSLSGETTGGTGPSSSVVVTGNLSGGPRLYRFEYSPATVTVTDVTSVGPSRGEEVREALSIRPNPGLGKMRFVFNATRRVPVDLAIYDIQGRRIRTIVSGVRGPGLISTDWDSQSGGSQLSAGVYLARLMVEGRSVVKRVVVLR